MDSCEETVSCEQYSHRDEFRKMLTELVELEDDDSYQVLQSYIEQHGGAEAVKADLDKLNSLDLLLSTGSIRRCSVDTESCTARYSTHSSSSDSPASSHPRLLRHSVDSTDSTATKAAAAAAAAVATAVVPSQRCSTDARAQINNNILRSKKVKRGSKGKIDISQPFDVRHVSHVGYEADNGWQFVNVDSQTRAMFESIGITPLPPDADVNSPLTPTVDQSTQSDSDTSRHNSVTGTTSRDSTSSTNSQPAASQIEQYFPPPPPPPPLPSNIQQIQAAVAAAAAAASNIPGAKSVMSSNCEKDDVVSQLTSNNNNTKLSRFSSCPPSRLTQSLHYKVQTQDPATQQQQQHYSRLTPSLHLMKILELPSCWSKMSSGERHKLVDLASSSAEFTKVKQLAEETAAGKLHSIHKIERVQNIAVYKQFMTRKTLMNKLQPTVNNELKLWHGTCESAVQNLVIGGFNRSYCGKNAVKFGKGVYFATEFSYAALSTYSPPDSQGLKYVFLSRVLVGEFEQGNEQLLEPPFKDDLTVRYDSVVDSKDDPKIFVIFHDAQSYPEYLITFF